MRNGRTQPLRLTSEGRALLKRAVPIWSQAQEAAKSLLGPETVELFENALQRLDAGQKNTRLSQERQDSASKE